MPSEGVITPGVIQRQGHRIVFACTCGARIIVPESLGGRTGRCAGCNRAVTVPGQGLAYWGRGQVRSHYMKDAKILSSEPNYAPRGSEYYNCQMETFLPGIFQITFWWAVSYDLMRTGGWLPEIAGMPAWPVTVRAWWLLAVYLMTQLCAVLVAWQYHRWSGKSYVEDRFMFARSGGYDVVRYVPVAGWLLAVGSVYVLAQYQPSVLSRLSWDATTFTVFGLGVVYVFVWWAANRVFRARFGDGTEVGAEEGRRK